jgi:dipeptidyl aminopeptidase/acylaminoacyl peptidase
MRVSGVLLALVPAVVWADGSTIEKLFSRPFVWGTSPSQLEWSEKGHTLVFLWNEQGNRFLDLYAYHPDTKRRARLTSLESFKDELLLTGEEKDDRQKLYLMPQAGLASFTLSDDGTQVAFPFRDDLFIVPTSGDKPPFRLTRTKNRETFPQFSPDGKKLAMISGGQVIVHDLGTGQIWQVTDIEAADGTLAAFRWSRDGKRIAYMTRRGQGRQMPLPNYSGQFVSATLFRRTVAGDDPLDMNVFVIAAEGGKPVRMEASSFGTKIYPGLIDWSPDSTKILWGVADAVQKKQQILVWDAGTGKRTVLTEESDPAWVFDSEYGWSPDSKTVWFTSERDGWAHLYTVPAAGGTVLQLTKGSYEVRGERFTHPPQWIGDSLYYSSTEDGTSERHFYRIRADGSGKQRLSKRPGINDGLVSEDGKHVAWMLADLENPLDLWVGDHRVTQSPRPEFYKASWPRTKFVSFPSRVDKKPVAAKILLPPGYNPGDPNAPKRPAVFFIHGAGYATSVLQQWGSYQEVRFAFNTYLANRGYVVLDMDYRGSSGYGRDWRAGVYLHMGGPDLEDVLGGLDYLKSLGNVDMSRVGLWGVSYGGFMTNMAMFLAPDEFKAGVAWASVNDWENYNAGYTEQRLNQPRRNPEAFRRSSPILFSSKLKNHLLMIHGMVDSNVLFQDAVQLTEKMIQEGRYFEHFYYPQEDHGFVRDETWKDAFRRTAEFLDRHLKP